METEEGAAASGGFEVELYLHMHVIIHLIDAEKYPEVGGALTFL